MVYDPKRGCVRGEDLVEQFEQQGFLLLPLTFEELRNGDYIRAVTDFKHEAGLTDWSPAEWSNAMAGEAGETCNLTKKLLRDGPEAVNLEDLGDEIADVVIYADLLATRLGLRLEDCVRRKFNKVSGRVGSDIKL